MTDEQQPSAAATDLAVDHQIVEIDHPPEVMPTRELRGLASVIGITRVGVWTGSSSLISEAAMRRDVQICSVNGIGAVSIMVNDFSKARSATPFATFNAARIRSFATMLRSEGIDVYLTSWIMPHRAFIERAATVLRDLAEASRARGVEWDAEEPWTQARSPMDYVEAAELVRSSMDSVRMGVTGIGYTPVEEFSPLAEVCDYVMPQIYTTSRSGLDPDTDVGLIAKRYRELFGQKTTVVGLAAYRQSGIPGHSVESALRTAFKHTHALGYVREVRYWSLFELRKSSVVASTIRSLALPGMPPPAELQGSVGQGGVNRPEDVLVVQQLLADHGYDVGPIDGIVGPRTIAAIIAFQSTFMANPDGRVDPGGATWRALT